MTNPAPASAQAPVLPTGQQLYDAIMAHIEPELTTEGVKTLEVKYKNETPGQLAERKNRYALAFELYEKHYAGYIQALQGQVGRYRKETFAQVEVEDRQVEQGILDNILAAA